MAYTKREKRIRRHNRLRKKVSGSESVPRLAVYKSNKHIYVQIVRDDAEIGYKRGHAVVATKEEAGNQPLTVLCSKTLVSASSLEKELRGQFKHGGNLDAAKVVGQRIGERAKAKGIENVVFDRGGYRYHGRIKALADAARGAGLKF